MRLQVFLSHSGICSRREALRLIQSGQVEVNNNLITEPSFDVDSLRDKVFVGGKIIKSAKKIYLKMNKPLGVVTTRKDRFADVTVSDLLPNKFKSLYPVGRLDKDTEGLLLLTNDGELTYRLTHPKFKIKKTYLVLIKGCINSAKKKRLESGIFLEGRRTAPCSLKVISSTKDKSRVKITISEGRKRQIRRMFKKLGNQVVRLKRVQEGSLELGNLEVGRWIPLSKRDIENLYKETSLKVDD